jgi:hypothetical protein
MPDHHIPDMLNAVASHRDPHEPYLAFPGTGHLEKRGVICGENPVPSGNEEVRGIPSSIGVIVARRSRPFKVLSSYFSQTAGRPIQAAMVSSHQT